MSETEKVLCPYCGAEMCVDSYFKREFGWTYFCHCWTCGSMGPDRGETEEKAREAALKRYKPNRAERKAAMKLEAGEHPMSYRRVVQILMNEYECASRDECDRACCAQCDLVMNRIDVLTALSLAIHAIQPDILNEFEGEDDD